MRTARDKLLADVEKPAGAAKLPAAKKALEFLVQRNLVQTAKRHVPNWLELARQFDPKNNDGYVEQFYEFDWFYRFEAAPTAQLPELVGEMAEWRKTYGDFKDKERAAFIWMELAKGKAELEDIHGAFQCLDEGRKLQPKDPRTRQQLQNGPLALGLGTGTAFAVSSSGHFLTNAHVASGPGKVFLQLPGHQQLLSAKMVAERADLDLALLKIDLPKDALVTPLAIAGSPCAAAWRRSRRLGLSPRHQLRQRPQAYERGNQRSARTRLTKHVLARSSHQSGQQRQPLCDAMGNVVGIVSARSQGVPGDSYGMALPGKEILDFLTGLEIKSVAKPGDQLLAWDESIAESARASPW